jgi:hypothetical protein
MGTTLKLHTLWLCREPDDVPECIGIMDEYTANEVGGTKDYFELCMDRAGASPERCRVIDVVVSHHDIMQAFTPSEVQGQVGIHRDVERT